MRGAQALLRHRMDFLLLLPRGHRVVLEVDGMHHSADPRRKADPAAYAANMRADRDLRLSGYDVFRFGATELQDKPTVRELLQPFFDDLFRSFDVTIPRNDSTPAG
jgi:very-short-patch-repair endonuclease